MDACRRARKTGPVVRTVLIVDDDPSFRDAARAVLAARGFRVVGEADGAVQGLALARRMRPDAVLLDVYLRDGDGVAVAERLSATGGCRVVLTSSDRDAAPDRVVRSCGAAGFLSKEDLAGAALTAYLAG
jgi:DNA-binding NarL/FixJ family response regulator